LPASELHDHRSGEHTHVGNLASHSPGAHAWIDEQVSRLGLVRARDGSSAYAPVMQPPPTAPGGPQQDTGAAPTGCMVNPARAEGAAA